MLFDEKVFSELASIQFAQRRKAASAAFGPFPLV
jgi:hypothetical protein